MALSALKMFAPYSGSAASSPGGRGSGATDRIAIWANGTDLTRPNNRKKERDCCHTVPHSIIAEILFST